jgi:hypothetical protein
MTASLSFFVFRGVHVHVTLAPFNASVRLCLKASEQCVLRAALIEPEFSGLNRAFTQRLNRALNWRP